MKKSENEKGIFLVFTALFVLVALIIAGSVVFWLRVASRQTVNTKTDIRYSYYLEAAKEAALFELKRPDSPADAYKWTGTGTTTYYTIIDGHQIEINIEDQETN